MSKILEWVKGIDVGFIMLILILLLYVFVNCQSADKNITAKDLDCAKVKISEPAKVMNCCLQMMSSGTGSDSKDVVCSPIVTEVKEYMRHERKKDQFTFCQAITPESDQRLCWEKLNAN